MTKMENIFKIVTEKLTECENHLTQRGNPTSGESFNPGSSERLCSTTTLRDLEDKMCLSKYVSYEKELICFFLENQTNLNDFHMIMRSRAGKQLEVVFDEMSGNIYSFPYKGNDICEMYTEKNVAAIYVGKARYEEEKFAFFYIIGQNGISYWDDKRTLKDETPIIRIQDYSKPTKIFQILESTLKPPHKEDIYKKLEILSESCIIHCKNGDIKANKLLLSQNSEFVFTRFTGINPYLYKEDTQNELDLKEFSKEVVNQYIRFLITGNVDTETILESMNESFYLASYLQSLDYIKFLYNIIRVNVGYIESKNIIIEIFSSDEK